MTQRYFGERWDAPAFDDAELVATPVGETCGHCGERITENDSGTFENWVTIPEGYSVRAVHIECFLRSVLGSPAHLQGLCYCNSGQPEEDDGRSWREQGRETMRLIQEQKA